MRELRPPVKPSVLRVVRAAAVRLDDRSSAPTIEQASVAAPLGARLPLSREDA